MPSATISGEPSNSPLARAIEEIVNAWAIARGIVYRKVGENEPGQVPPFHLGRGDVAVIGPQGPIAEIEKNEGSGQVSTLTDLLRRLPGLDAARKLNVNDRTLNWGVYVFIGAVIFLTLIVLLAGIARRRRRRDR